MNVLIVAPPELDQEPKEPTEILEGSGLVRRAMTLFRFELEPLAAFCARARVPVVVLEGAPGFYAICDSPAPIVLAKMRDPIGVVAVWGRSMRAGGRSPWVAHAITTAHRRRGEVEVYAPGSPACLSRFELLTPDGHVAAWVCTTQGQAAARELAKQHPDAVALRIAVHFDDRERHYTPPVALGTTTKTPPQTPPTPASAAPALRPRTRPKHSTPNPDELPQHLAHNADPAQDTAQASANPLTTQPKQGYISVVRAAWSPLASPNQHNSAP